MKIVYFLPLLILLSFSRLMVQCQTGADKNKTEKKDLDLTTPICKAQSIVSKHIGYTVSYNPAYHNANWVGYLLTRQKATSGEEERTNNFKPDPTISSGMATDDDYNKSGFDRGHLAPAADMSWSKQAMDESFYYSNMTPQSPSFNRGIWKNLEEQIRSWASEYDSLYIITGPILTTGLKRIGPDKMAIPQRFFKVVLNYTQKETKAIGFLFENKEFKASLSECAISIDSVEKVTGINFYAALDDKAEQQVESRIDLSRWKWGTMSAIKKTTAIEKTEAPAKIKNDDAMQLENKKLATNKPLKRVRCKGITKKGKRCKRMTSDSSGYCSQHKP